MWGPFPFSLVAGGHPNNKLSDEGINVHGTPTFLSLPVSGFQIVGDVTAAQHFWYMVRTRTLSLALLWGKWILIVSFSCPCIISPLPPLFLLFNSDHEQTGQDEDEDWPAFIGVTRLLCFALPCFAGLHVTFLGYRARMLHPTRVRKP